jgi:hypothetical protein
MNDHAQAQATVVEHGSNRCCRTCVMTVQYYSQPRHSRASLVSPFLSRSSLSPKIYLILKFDRKSEITVVDR